MPKQVFDPEQLQLIDNNMRRMLASGLIGRYNAHLRNMSASEQQRSAVRAEYPLMAQAIGRLSTLPTRPPAYYSLGKFDTDNGVMITWSYVNVSEALSNSDGTMAPRPGFIEGDVNLIEEIIAGQQAVGLNPRF